MNNEIVSRYGVVGITASAFDLLHAGHLLMLEESERECDYLIAALHIDPSKERSSKNKPIQSVFERYTQLKACKYVDEIITYETEKDLEDILLSIELDVRFIGEEYKGKKFTGIDICNSLDIDIYYNKRSHNFSSTDLRARIANANESTRLLK